MRSARQLTTWHQVSGESADIFRNTHRFEGTFTILGAQECKHWKSSDDQFKRFAKESLSEYK